MKNSDIATLILIASISMLVAYFVTDGIIGKPANETVKVKTIDPISARVEEPDSSIFNKDAINPTIEVTIGDQDQSITQTQNQNQQ
jgi:hypothetical protein